MMIDDDDHDHEDEEDEDEEDDDDEDDLLDRRGGGRVSRKTVGTVGVQQ